MSRSIALWKCVFQCAVPPTLLLGAGVHPRLAQQLLRHASSKTTIEIYSHVTAAQERQAAEVLEAALVG